MIHVAESKSTQRFGDFFVRNIIKVSVVILWTSHRPVVKLLHVF